MMMKSKIYYLAAMCTVFFMGCETEHKAIELSELTITEIHNSFKTEEYTSVELVAAYIQRIEKLDNLINSITVINPKALDQADALDAEFKRTGILRPLHGIPIIIKDNINTAGLPTTAGSLALKNYVPDEDAFIIQKLVEAGAIILAKSNMAEWAFSPMHTESSTAGITRNPYNTNHVPAGSSGGTAAAIASNFGTIGLGTDTGNSVRGPSSHTALVGFRATLGLVSRSAIVPLYLRNDMAGPMGRTVEDATRILEVIAGFDKDDALTRFSKGKIPDNYTQFLDKNALQGSRIGVLRAVSDDEVHPKIKSLFDKALIDLDALGATIVDPFAIPDFEELKENQWCATFRDDVEKFLTAYVKNDTVKTMEDIMRIGSRSQWAKERVIRNAANSGRWEDSEIACEDAYTDVRRIAFRMAIETMMDSLKLDAIVYPTWNQPPAKLELFLEEYKGDNSQLISPHTGQPAFTVPMGFMDNNLPAGLQFLGRMYDEPTLIGLSYSYEQGTKHRRIPDL